jgi:hypothetical protein
MSDKGIDRLVRQAIASARARKPDCSVREAAEMTAGRHLSEEEWDRKGPIWMRNWMAPPAPHLLPEPPTEGDAGPAPESTRDEQGGSNGRGSPIAGGGSSMTGLAA